MEIIDLHSPKTQFYLLLRHSTGLNLQTLMRRCIVMLLASLLEPPFPDGWNPDWMAVCHGGRGWQNTNRRILTKLLLLPGPSEQAMQFSPRLLLLLQKNKKLCPRCMSAGLANSSKRAFEWASLLSSRSYTSAPFPAAKTARSRCQWKYTCIWFLHCGRTSDTFVDRACVSWRRKRER